MAYSRGGYILLTIILFTGLSSCGLPAATVLPAATLTSTPVPLPTSTAPPTTAPTSEPSATPAATLAPTAESQNLYLPVGVAAVVQGSGQVSYYDLNGQLLGALQAPGLGTGIYQQAHIAGPLNTSQPASLPPLVFYSTANGGELWMNDNGNSSLIKAAPNLFNLTGVPGKPIIAYSLPEYTAVGVRSLVYIGDAQSLPAASAVLDSTNSQSYAIKPVAISMAGGQPSGIWYTTVPYGIGGDIVFEPRSALYHLDLSNSNVDTLLDLNKSPSGLSQDQTWVAYTTGGNGPMNILHNFDSSTVVSFPLREDSSRGAGDAVFSPDNQYVAWREIGGSLMDQPSTFHETIRIGNVNGTILTELPDSSLTAISGFSTISSVVPVGWIDTQTIALEVRDVSGNAANLLKVNHDGSGLAMLAPGAFVGFLFP